MISSSMCSTYSFSFSAPLSYSLLTRGSSLTLPEPLVLAESRGSSFLTWIPPRESCSGRAWSSR